MERPDSRAYPLEAPAFGEPPRHDPIRVDPDHRGGILNDLGVTADFDAAGSPRVHTLEVIDDNGGSPAALDVAILLGLLEQAAADIDGVALGVLAPAHGRHMGCAVGTDGGDPPQPRLAVEIGEFAVGEARHHVLHSVVTRWPGGGRFHAFPSPDPANNRPGWSTNPGRGSP